MADVDKPQLERLARAWRSESEKMAGLGWHALTGVSGQSSDTLNALRECAEPAGAAMRAISQRYQTMAGLLDKFLVDVDRRDTEVAHDLDQLRPR